MLTVGVTPVTTKQRVYEAQKMDTEIEIGDRVIRKGDSYSREVIDLLDKGTHVSALLLLDNDRCWWPVKELKLKNPKQEEMKI